MTPNISTAFDQRAQNDIASSEVAQPVCIRLTATEKAKLRQWAGRRTLSAYVRDRLFGDAASPRRKQRIPLPDYKALACVLSALGQSRLSQNMNQIAKLAHNGALPLDDALCGDLAQACEDISAMRSALVAALNVAPED
ncbi:MAG: hypothetical protein ACQRW7_06550 [Caulobacterales bacterium]|uniref:hypothetical protein n=1 Tax=Glycocaulis sp. TaxID=1969725 RepID=UPI003FA1394C